MAKLTWNSNHELAWLSRLGNHSEVGKKTTRKRLLELYLEGIELRVRWDGIEKEKVVNAVKLMLKEEERR